MQRLKRAAFLYSLPATRIEMSRLAVAVFSTLIAIALGIHYATIE